MDGLPCYSINIMIYLLYIEDGSPQEGHLLRVGMGGPKSYLILNFFWQIILHTSILVIILNSRLTGQIFCRSTENLVRNTENLRKQQLPIIFLDLPEFG